MGWWGHILENGARGESKYACAVSGDEKVPIAQLWLSEPATARLPGARRYLASRLPRLRSRMPSAAIATPAGIAVLSALIETPTPWMKPCLRYPHSAARASSAAVASAGSSHSLRASSSDDAQIAGDLFHQPLCPLP